MQEEIGATAGAIWQALNAKGELSLLQLKREVKGKTPLFDWAIGWLAREDKIVITAEKRSFRIQLKGIQPIAAGRLTKFIIPEVGHCNVPLSLAWP